jgi:lipoyl(octanoyl) transferase
MVQVKFIDLGLKDYKATWDFQQSIHEQIITSKVSETDRVTLPTLIFVEHPHVFTLGKSGQKNNLLVDPGFLESIRATYYETDRGGDITYHGPGQIVGYPVFDLGIFKMGVKKYIFTLEESIIHTLREFDIIATRLEGATGVWIDANNQIRARKICAIGVKVSRGVTMHGFALNVNTDLNYFSYINPCGFHDKGVTSIEKEAGKRFDLSDVKNTLLNILKLHFDFQLT